MLTFLDLRFIVQISSIGFAIDFRPSSVLFSNSAHDFLVFCTKILNLIGFRKALKKYEKITKNSVLDAYMNQKVRGYVGQ